MRGRKIAAMIGTSALGILAFFGVRLLLAPQIPLRPKDMPIMSVWVPGPNAPLDLSPRGVWLGCWLDKTRNVDRCKVADYRRHIEFEEEFAPVTGGGPISDAYLKPKQIGTMDLWTWVEEHKREVPVVRLENGTVLVPRRDVNVLGGRYSH